MKKLLKWVLIVGGGLVVLVIALLLIVPMFVDLQKYKPEIERRVSEATGRPFAMGGDINLSLFPWAGVSLSDLRLGSPPGFEAKEFLTVKSFEVRVRVIPLLSRDIDVKRFVVKGARVVLEKNKKGLGNWEGIGKRSGKAEEKPQEAEPDEGFPIESLAVGECSISGSLLWIDQAKGERKEVSDLSLRLKDVSLDHPIQMALSAKLDGKPFSLKGKVGPLGDDPGKGSIPLDFDVSALKQLEIKLKGQIAELATKKRFDISIEVSPFSPRKVLTALDRPFPVATKDPKALSKIALKFKVKGNTGEVSIYEGAMDLDQSKLNFSAKAKEFTRPDVAFSLDLDQIDLDRYLPPPGEKEKKSSKTKGEVKRAPGKKIDYTPLRRLVLKGALRVGKLTAKGIKMEDLSLKVRGKNGIITMDPLSVRLYQGTMLAKATADVRKDSPRSRLELEMKDVQAGPLIQDFMKKDILEGKAHSKVAISMSGDDAKKIKASLNGKGAFVFKDGAIVGIDLAGMVRNVTTTFGLAEEGGKKPRTDFAELSIPFTVTKGVVTTRNTSLKSPFLRVQAAGKADLVKESLDFRLEPKFVGTIKGQGDTEQRAGIKVPVLVTGTFSSPKFRPDLKSILEDELKERIKGSSQLDKLLPGKDTKKGDTESLEEKAKGFLKGFLKGK
ncbi:MAG: AsmA family protein [Desulfobacteraceae bacterium]|nr:AsmA family protein [Desulfobacteraceae bacterium]